MGVSHLVLVNPARFPDDEAIARAAGAEDVLVECRVCQSLDEALEGTVFALALRPGTGILGQRPCRRVRPRLSRMGQAQTGEVALVFGTRPGVCRTRM